MRFSTGTKLKLTIDAIGQILYPATMMGMVSCGKDISRDPQLHHVLFL